MSDTAMQDERQHMRQYFVDTWHKREQYTRLSALEQQILDVIHMHPEYQTALNTSKILDKDYSSDNNPFLHMSLHLGLLEQLNTDRPTGIRNIYQKLFEKFTDEHKVQHIMMDIMAEIIWDAQQQHKLPDEALYLQKLLNL